MREPTARHDGLAAGKPNSQYNLAKVGGLAARVAEVQRREMYERFLRTCELREADTILDVGVTSDRTYSSSNYLELWYPYKSMITAAGIDDASFLESAFPGLRFVRADGLCLPFADGAFDVVHASAVIEHVGSHERQAKFVQECSRVTRRALFVTTPNRWFPIEVHTSLPILHWLPPPVFQNHVSDVCRFRSSQTRKILISYLGESLFGWRMDLVNSNSKWKGQDLAAGRAISC